jgi:selenoprotein W-related protein
LKQFEPGIESITMMPSGSGRFEVTVNEKLLFSKITLGRHAEPGEIVGLVQKYLKEGKK